jgi:hypothetical protein
MASATEIARAKRSIFSSSHRDIGPLNHLHPVSNQNPASEGVQPKRGSVLGTRQAGSFHPEQTSR